MAVTDRFYETLNTLSQNPKNEDIRNAIISWCGELDLVDKVDPEIIANYAFNWLEKTSNDTFLLYKRLLEGTNSKIFKIWSSLTKKPLESIQEKDYKEIIDNSLQEIINKDKQVEIKFILIIAFVLVGVGLTLYFLNQKQKDSVSEKSKVVSDADPKSSSIEDTSNAILVLVINAQHEKIIQSLRNKKSITESEGQSLYSATQALWMGSKSEVIHQLREWFEEGKSVQEDEQSEYDVYLLEIGLKKPEPGFKKSAKSLDRLDAFRELNTNFVDIKFSSRLPNKAYANPIFYNR